MDRLTNGNRRHAPDALDKPASPPPRASSPRDPFYRRVLFVAGITLGLLLLWVVSDVLLLIFGGVLLAIFVYGLATRVSQKTGIPYRAAYVVVLVGLLIFLLLIGWLLAPGAANQFLQLQLRLPAVVADLRGRLNQYEWGRLALEQFRHVPLLSSQTLGRVPALFSTTAGFLGGIAVILFVGLYLAYDPEPYLNGLLHLVPIPHRPRARQLLLQIGHVLWRWLIGRLIGMLIIGTLVGVGLSLLGVPLALALGALSALLDFIPNIGPVLAAVPAVLIGLVQAPLTGLYVVLMYMGVHAVEGYLITPQIERRAVFLPPALTLTAQLVLYLVFGFLGVLLAIPITASLTVAVKMLYVNDTLKDPVDFEE